MITDEMRTYRNNIKYKVESLDIIFSNGNIENIKPGMVTHLYIEKDFDNSYFPIMNLSVVMDDKVYDRINNENETVKFRLKINKMVYTANGKYVKYESFCNDIFICFLNKEVIIRDKEAYDDKKNVERSSTQNDRANNRNFYLFKEDVVKCKKVHNLSIKSSSLTDLVVYLFQVTDIRKLLMSKIDNPSGINDLLIPTGNIAECLKYVDELKGFYNRGSLLFFDIDTAYFIDKSSKCTAWRKNEVRVTHMHVSNKQGIDSQITGVYVDKDRKSSHIFANTDRIKIVNTNLVNDQLNGNNITIVNNKSRNVSQVNEKLTQVGKANKKVLVAKEDNKYMVEALKYRMKENECVMDISFLGIDIGVLSPNKEFLLTYEDTKHNLLYGGNYRISKSVTTLRKDGEELVGNIECLFKKQA